MNHTIVVSFVGTRVHAEPNPLPAPAGDVVSPEDTVTWQFDPPRRLDVKFQLVRDLPAGTPQPTSSPLGPCSSIVPDVGQIVATIRKDVPTDIAQTKRFFYKLLDENGVPLEWHNPVEVDLINGGGIDIPRTPP